MRILFVCNQGRHRSRTAAELFGNEHETRYAGLYSEHPLDKTALEWTEVIIVMDDAQRREIAERFPKQYLSKRILSLDVPDIYSYNQPELKRLLLEKMRIVEPTPEL